MVRAKKVLEVLHLIATGQYKEDNWSKVLDLIAQLFNADGSAIGRIEGNFVIYDKVSSSFKRLAPDYEPKKYRVPIFSKSLASALLSKRNYIIANDYQNSPFAVESWKRLGLKQLMMVFMGEGNALGILSVGNISKKRDFTRGDAKVLMDLAFIISVILEKERKIEDLSEIAFRDPLTGLFNRRYFERFLEMEVERARRGIFYKLSLLMMDIDDFKRLNDEFGHLCGDLVLMEIGRIIRQNLRRSDVACRYGGEEFAIILPFTTSMEAFVIGERLRRKIYENPISFKGKEIRVSVSVGASQYRPPESKEEFINRTDRALYRAKLEGKNKVVVEEKLVL